MLQYNPEETLRAAAVQHQPRAAAVQGLPMLRYLQQLLLRDKVTLHLQRAQQCDGLMLQC